MAALLGARPSSTWPCHACGRTVPSNDHPDPRLGTLATLPSPPCGLEEPLLGPSGRPLAGKELSFALTAAGVECHRLVPMCDEEYLWPKKGDQAFRPGGWSGLVPPESCLGSAEQWAVYVESYWTAADLLSKHLEENKDHRERQYLFPAAVFLYRHYLELALKELIFWASCSLDDDDEDGAGVPLRHELLPLWAKWRKQIRELDPDDAREDDGSPHVECILTEFDQMDKRGTRLRYGVDDKGRPLGWPTIADTIDIPNLRDVMRGVRNYFEGTASYLIELNSWGS
jgi:hypothetical protein